MRRVGREKICREEFGLEIEFFKTLKFLVGWFWSLTRSGLHTPRESKRSRFNMFFVYVSVFGGEKTS